MTPLHPNILVIDDIRRSSEALADIADAAPPDTPVATCGEWTLADLVWHLTDVQSFWVHIIENRPAGPETYDRPTRPADDLGSGLRDVGQRLTEALAAADPDDRAWSWSDDQTVGFSVRRQIHEAMIHGIDGMLAVGLPVPDIAAELAADGIDEMVNVMLTGTPGWATFEASPDVVELRTSDTGDRWVMRSGRVVGTEPTSGADVELSGYEISPSATPTATIVAPALDLLLWVWGRGADPEFGSPADAEAARAMRQTIVDASQ